MSMDDDMNPVLAGVMNEFCEVLNQPDSTLKMTDQDIGAWNTLARTQLVSALEEIFQIEVLASDIASDVVRHAPR